MVSFLKLDGFNKDSVLQFYTWFKFYFLLFWGTVMDYNEFETKENKISTKDKIDHFRYIKILT